MLQNPLLPAPSAGQKNGITPKITSVLLTLILAGSVVGCMPAKRVSGSSGSSARSSAGVDAIAEVGTSSTITAMQRRVLVASREWIGTPYSYGGTSTRGVDCSGFVRAVFNAAGVRLPRTSVEQSSRGREVSLTDVQPGDLLFFNTTGEGVSHVGISIGGVKFVHASSSRGVTVSSLEEGYYRERFIFARRLL